jgi:hypothetical protein
MMALEMFMAGLRASGTERALGGAADLVAVRQ